MKWRRMRSAQSWIGVNGFLISWASRRATSRHVANTLSPNQRCHVVKDHHGPIHVPGLGRQGCRGYRQMHFVPILAQSHLVRASASLLLVRLHQHLGKRLEIRPREHGGGRLAHGTRLERQQTSGRAIDRAQPTLGVHRHDTGCDPLENGLDVVPPLFALLVLPFQVSSGPLEPSAACG